MTKGIWTGYVCGDCGRGFRWTHRCKATGARFTTYNRTSKDGEPFGMNVTAERPFRMPSSQHYEV